MTAAEGNCLGVSQLDALCGTAAQSSLAGPHTVAHIAPELVHCLPPLA